MHPPLPDTISGAESPPYSSQVTPNTVFPALPTRRLLSKVLLIYLQEVKSDKDETLGFEHSQQPTFQIRSTKCINKTTCLQFD